MAGKKDDRGRARLDLVDWKAVLATGEAFAKTAPPLGAYVSEADDAPGPETLPGHDLIPLWTTDEVQAVMDVGRRKYAAWNFLRVQYARARYFAAAMRHLIAWWLGQKKDPDDGLHPLAHAQADCMILRMLDAQEEREEDKAAE